jgi:hypothetical protein
MKPNTQVITTHSTIGGQTKAMGLDTTAMAHILSVLTNLYADPIMAVIREYSTNGLDAAREAGSAEPIKVTLPTSLAPTLTIQDFGIGMTTDTILDHYSLYGRSDKRESNDVVGMLGLGCKSGLTYSNTFTITSVRNGVRTVAVASKGTDGIGQIEIVDTASTSERNGTTITIPVKSQDVITFRNKAGTFYSYWTPGTVIVDGSVPALCYSDWTKAGSVDAWYKPDRSYDSEKIVLMGNVPYRVKSTLLDDFNGARLVIAANIGDVSFAPSREELMYDKRTTDFLARKVKEIKSVIQTEIDAQLANAADAPTAWKMRKNNEGFSFLKGVKWDWNGVPIPEVISITGCMAYQNYTYRAGSYGKAGRGWNSRYSQNAIHIRGFAGSSFPNPLKEYANKNRETVGNLFYGIEYIVLSADSASDWVNWLEWDDVKALLPVKVSIPTVRGAISKNSGKVLASGGDFSGAIASDNPAGKYFMVSPADRSTGYNQYLRVIQAGFIPVIVYKRDETAFRAAYATFTLSQIEQSITEMDKARSDDWYLSYAASQSSALGKIKGKKLLDPALDAVVSLTHKGNENFTDRDRLSKATAKINVLVRDYQMLNNYNLDAAHSVEYVNALYTYRNGA